VEQEQQQRDTAKGELPRQLNNRWGHFAVHVCGYRSFHVSLLCFPFSQAGAQSLKVPLTQEQADALYAKFDADGDGEISYSELVRMLASAQ
jgi:hypothetical protein